MITLTLTRREITYPLADHSNDLKANNFDFVLRVRDACMGKNREDEITIEIELELLKMIYVWCFNYHIGMASYINPIMKTKILGQLMPLADFAEMNEAAQFLLFAQSMDAQGQASVDSKCDATDQSLKIN